MTKFCNTCKENKDISEFNFRNKLKDIRQSNCRDCKKEMGISYYNKNKEYHFEKNKKHRLKSREFLKQYKKSLSCKLCGENHPACLDFHHINPNEKDIEVSTIVGYGLSVDRLINEINKCEVLCSNCHRKFHWNEKNK